MASPHDQNPPNDDALTPPGGEVDVPIESSYGEEELETEAPRRAASAEFIVDSDVGSDAALREAMDPANQSLAEALRLSFRVLQVVMVLLIILFAISGFTTVESNQTGVKLLFGRIVSDDGQGALTPGPKFNLPYPVGEFVLIDAQGGVTLRRQFESPIPENMTREQAIAQRTEHQALIPGLEGSVITSDGGLAHLRVDASFVVEMPVSLLETIKWDDVRTLVQLSVQHAVVKVAAQSSLDDLTERSAAIVDEIRMAAQTRLDDLGAGVRLASLSFPERPTPPLAIERSNSDLVAARDQANNRIAQARGESVKTLVEIAGPEYEKLVELINAYEEALRFNDDDRIAGALAAINEQLDSDETSGEVYNILSSAKDHRTEVAMTLGNEAQRFAGLFPAFQQNPELVIREQWLDAYQAVIGGPGVEMYKVPESMHLFHLNIYGSDAVMNLRRDRRLEMRKNAAMQAEMAAGGTLPSFLRGRDMNMSSTGERGGGKMLNVEGGRIQTGGNN